MSDAERFYRDEIRKRYLDVLSGLDLPADQLDEMKKRYLEAIDEALDSGLAMSIAHQDVVNFIEGLLTRQLKSPLNFKALYKKKEDLNRRLFGTP